MSGGAKRHLIVLAHPRERSFTRDAARTYLESVAALGHEARVRDLYAVGFNPVASAADLDCMKTGRIPADIAAEHEHVRWADVIVFCHPIWWIGLPAIIKGWVDRVFVLGFAYAHSPGGVVGRLLGKKAVILTSSGSTQAEFDSTGKMKAILVAQDFATMEFCGLEMVEHLHFAPVGSRSTGAMIDSYHERIRLCVAKNFNRKERT